MKTLTSITAALTLLAGCAQSPDTIAPTYIPAATYSSMSCRQLVGEANRVNAEVARVTGKQQAEVNEDAIATGVGLVLFWPALFFLADGDYSAELASAKGQAQAIQTAYRQKGC